MPTHTHTCACVWCNMARLWTQMDFHVVIVAGEGVAAGAAAAAEGAAGADEEAIQVAVTEVAC